MRVNLNLKIWFQSKSMDLTLTFGIMLINLDGWMLSKLQKCCILKFLFHKRSLIFMSKFKVDLLIENRFRQMLIVILEIFCFNLNLIANLSQRKIQITFKSLIKLFKTF